MPIKKITTIAIFIALSAVLANIKIYGSIAFDFVPALIFLYIFNNKNVLLIAVFGNIISSLLAGFPFTIPVHLFVSIGLYLMFIIALKIQSKFLKSIFIILFNSIIISLALLITFPFNIYITLVPLLLLSTTLNVIVAAIIYKVLKRSKYEFI